MNSLRVLFLLFSFGTVHCYLPPSVSVCSRNDPEFDRCVLTVLEHLKPHLLSGDYGNGTKLPSMDPGYMDRLEVDDGSNLKATFLNVVMTGASSFQVNKLRFNFQKKTIQVLYTVPQLRMTGKYRMKLKLFNFPIDGEGDSMLDLTNVKTFVKSRYTFEPNENGRQTMRFIPIDLKIKLAGSARFNLTNLVKNRPQLSQAANDALNASPEMILERAMPAVEQFFTNMFVTIANGIMQEATEEEVFPVE